MVWASTTGPCPTVGPGAVRGHRNGAVGLAHRTSHGQQRVAASPQLSRAEVEAVGVQQEHQVQILEEAVDQLIAGGALPRPAREDAEPPQARQRVDERVEDRLSPGDPQPADDGASTEQRANLAEQRESRARLAGDRHRRREWTTTPQMATSIATGQKGAATMATGMIADSDLQALPSGAVAAETLGQRLERDDVVGDRRGAQPIVERLLSQRARRPIEHREHLVEVQIAAGAIVERRIGAASRDADAVVLGDERHRALGPGRAAPVEPQPAPTASACHTSAAGEPSRSDHVPNRPRRRSWDTSWPEAGRAPAHTFEAALP